MTQKSKVDWWIFILGWSAGVIPVVWGVVELAIHGNTQLAQLLLLFGVGTSALTAAFTTPMRYGISDGRISIRFGLFCIRIPVAEVTEVTPSWSLLSSPAWSFDRIRIRFHRKGKSRSILISPEDKNAFMDYLRSVDNEFVQDGEGIRRQASSH